jgi:membrane-associated phospholipid phosphatase
VRSFRVQLTACVGLAAALRLAAYDVGPIQHADVRLLENLDHPAAPVHRLAEVLISPFDPVPYLLVTMVVLVAAVLGGRARTGVIAVGAMGAAAVTTQLLKHAVAEPRPQAAGLHLPADAWPSGHTTAAAALAVAFVLITPPGRRRVVALVAATGTALVAIALLVLGHHYPSDVLGGLCVAAAWAAAAAELTRRRAPRAAS